MRARALLSVFAVTAAVAAPLVAHATSDAPATVQLTNSVVPGLSVATDLGAVPATQKIQVIVSLAHPDPAGERATVAAIYNPNSPTYHRFLTPTQWASRFGVPAATYQRVNKWLSRDGMTVGYAPATNAIVVVDGTMAQAEQTFRVTLHNYRMHGVTFRANVEQATVPAGVVAVRGLETASAYQLPSHPSGRPAQDTCLQATCIGVVTPEDLWSVYQQPSTDRGTGVKVGIIGEGDTATTIKALRFFEAKHGLPTVNTRSIFVDNDRSDDSGKGEWQIDSQAIDGMAPDIAELSFYFAQDLSSTDAALSYWANEDSSTAPAVANMSIGGCEAINVALGGAATTEGILQQIAGEGRTLFVSSGDTGGSCAIEPLVNLNGVENTGVPNVQWPASSDAVVSVGGTVLYTDGGSPAQRTLEYTWTHGGGGTSFFVPRPAWQAAVPVIQGRCVADLSGQPVSGDTPCRGVPDVSALSGDITFNQYSTVDETDTDTFGAGTSLSSPLWAGMWARVLAAHATPLGFAAPILYGVGNDAASDADGFYDISTGTNVQYQAIPRNPADPSGWDYTNGFGVPQLDGLMKHVAGGGDTAVGSNPPETGTDQVIIASGSGGGGTCGPNGVVDDPTGDDWLGVGVNTSDTDLTQVVASYDDTAQAITWTAHVVDLASNPEAKAFEFGFSYNGTALDLNTERDLTGAINAELDSVDPTTGNFTTVATTGITANWDDAGSAVSVTLPLAVYNAAVQPTSPLAPGATLTGLDYFADRNPTQTNRESFLVPGDEATTSCGYVIPAPASPSPSPTATTSPSPTPNGNGHGPKSSPGPTKTPNPTKGPKHR